MKFQFEFYYYKLAAKFMTAKTRSWVNIAEKLSANNSLLLCCDKPLVL